MMKKETSLHENTIEIPMSPGKNLLEALAGQGIFMDGGCNGAGRCGRCRVRFSEEAPLPAPGDRRLLSPEELRSKVRLACLHKADRAYTVTVKFEKSPEIAIISAGPGMSGEDCGLEKAAVKNSCDSQQAAGYDSGGQGQAAAYAEGSHHEAREWLIAADLGTTTVVVQAQDMMTGEVLGVQSFMNPQRKFGSDVVSRMQAAESGHGRELKDCVEKKLCDSIRELKAGPGGSPAGIFLAGNTVMEHLLAGLSVEGLSRYPFRPVTLEEQKTELEGGETVTLLPGLSAFVGADLLAGVLSCKMAEREEITLLIDLGTNGELVIGNRERLLCTATAAGPAFEGGAGGRAAGTDMVAVTAELLEKGILDETGLLAEPWFENGITVQTAGSASGVTITQSDIRSIQMAKAAVYAGIRVLVKEYGIELSDISKVFLAGGFGYYLDVEKAAAIGLFPAQLTDRVTAAGNTSLLGAFLYGQAAAGQENGRRNVELSETAVGMAEQIRRICSAVNLAEHPDFEELYLYHMHLEPD